MADRFDLDAIEADDMLLDLLAAGGESAWEAGEHDPALKLLAGLRLAVEVEDELPVETIDDPESFLARCAALNPVTDPFARKMAARSLALGVAAVAALSVSGVAAAVTGDPLSPYEKVIEKVVDGLRQETSFPKEQLDGMPVMDKTIIVKVAKDYQEKQKEAREEQKAKDDGAAACRGACPRPARAEAAAGPADVADRAATADRAAGRPGGTAGRGACRGEAGRAAGGQAGRAGADGRPDGACRPEADRRPDGSDHAAAHRRAHYADHAAAERAD